MNKELKETVHGIATVVRKWAENKASHSGGVYPNSLMGLCAISSAKLHLELVRKSIPSTLNLGTGHVFVMVDDYIVDVTATQFPEFSDTKVVIIHERIVTQYDYYDVSRKFKKCADLVKAQITEGWPEDEIAYEKHIA
jgi:hypothetical protein